MQTGPYLTDPLPPLTWRDARMALLKAALCVAGLYLYFLNPERDLRFFEDVAAHEGFGTTEDAYVIGFAQQTLVTWMLSPVAVLLIAYGIWPAERISLWPRFDHCTGWGVFASLVAALMLIIESWYVVYGLSHPQHDATVLRTLLNIAFIYLWWSCSIAHGRNRL